MGVKSENVQIYKYITRPTKQYPKGYVREVEARGTAPSLDMQERIKKIYSDRLPKGVEFDFNKYPSTGVSGAGETKNLSGSIRSALKHETSSLNLDEDARMARTRKTHSEIHDILDKQVLDFETNDKIFPNERFRINSNEIINQMKKSKGRGTDFTTVAEALKTYPDQDKIQMVQQGSNSISGLSKTQKEYFRDNFRTKSLSQMSSELTGGTDYTSREYKAMYQKIMRYRDTLIRENLLTMDDFDPAKLININRNKNVDNPKETFSRYRKAQENLMQLDPKTYPKGFNPGTLDSRLASRLQLADIREATKLLPEDLLASLEHFEGLVPGTIIQDPGALRKVGPSTRRYNFKIMGAKAKGPYRGRYKKVKNDLRTAKAELNLGNKQKAKAALREVNKVYSDLVEDIPTLKRSELPNYQLKGNKIIEKNLKEIAKPQTFQKVFDQYFRNVAGVATERELERIRKVQPNVGEVLDLYRQGKNKEAKEIIKKRIPEITEMTKPNQGGGRLAVKSGMLFSETFPGARATGEFISDTFQDLATKGSRLRGLGKLAGIAGVGYGIYDTGVAFQEGKSAPEMAFRFVGADPLYNIVKEYNRLPDELQEIQKRVNQQETFDSQIQDGFLDEGLVTLRGRPEVSQEDLMKLEAGKQQVKEQIETENKERAAGRMGFVNMLKQKFYDVTQQPYSLALANGGRVQLKDGGDPKDIGRRKFLKFGVALASIPFLGRYIKPATKAVPQVVEAVSRSADSVPTYLNDLISKIKMMGKSNVIGKADNPNGFIEYELGDYKVTDGMDFTRVRKQNQRGEYIDSEVEMEIQRDPETGGLLYEEATATPDIDGKLKDVDFGIDDIDHEEMRKFTYEK